MPNEIKVHIDPSSCAYFRINPDKYKENLMLAFHGLTHNISVSIEPSHSTPDGVFPLAISLFTEATHNQQSTALCEVQQTATTVFQALSVNA